MSCSLIIGNETHYCGTFQSRRSKTIAILTFCCLTFLDIALLYGAIWFEHFGSDNWRTLVIRLFTSLCWTGMANNLIGFADTVRYSIGQYPQMVCHVQQFLRKIVKDEILMFYNAMTLSRYALIFWLKNPAAVDDDFWNIFINIWITIACTVMRLFIVLCPVVR